MRPLHLAAALLLGTATLACVRATVAEGKAKAANVKPIMTLYGRHSKIAKEKVLRVTSAKQWKDLWMLHRIGSTNPKDLPDNFEYAELDFDRVMVVGVFGGPGFGYTADSISDDGRRLTIRLDAHPFQSGGRYQPVEGWGILVLPFSEKEIVLEQDVKSLIADPPKWVEWVRIPALAVAKKP
jgi:hypothetical protein